MHAQHDQPGDGIGLLFILAASGIGLFFILAAIILALTFPLRALGADHWTVGVGPGTMTQHYGSSAHDLDDSHPGVVGLMEYHLGGRHEQPLVDLEIRADWSITGYAMYTGNSRQNSPSREAEHFLGLGVGPRLTFAQWGPVRVSALVVAGYVKDDGVYDGLAALPGFGAECQVYNGWAIGADILHAFKTNRSPAMDALVVTARYSF